MDISYAYGFTLDKNTGRVYLINDKTTGFDQGIPHNANTITTGTDKGVIQQKTTKVGVDLENKLVYFDIKGQPYIGTVNTYGYLPHDEQGRLIVDSVGEITRKYKGLGFTANGGVAMSVFKPNLDDPIIGGQTFDDGTYKYCVFYSDRTTGYEATRTKAGCNVELEVLLVGAGGAGKGQTTAFGKGGDGGGGELVIGKLTSAYEGSIFVTVPNGGSPKGDSPDNTTVKEGNTVLTATAGKSATDKKDGAGFPRTQVPESWWTLRQFNWFSPESHYVGGVVQSGTQNYPSALVAGEGGAGTKDSNAGKGGESYVAIRWKK